MEWIVKYWVEAAFGVIITFITFLFRRYIKLNKKEQEAERASFRASLMKEISDSIKNNFDIEFQKSTQRDIEINNKLADMDNTLTTVKAGVLSVQKRDFIHDGRQILHKDYITFEDMQSLDAEHKIYNALGGNNTGDSLFNLVKKKFESQIDKDYTTLKTTE